MITHTVYDIKTTTTEDNLVWLVHYHRGDTGQLWVNGFPHVLFPHLIAEYDHDPHDIDTLVDLALHQPHMIIQHTDDDFVYHVSADNARSGHLARLEASKQNYTYLDPYNLLPEIKAKHDPYDPEIAVHRSVVRSIRNSRQKVG
jgi:hypothetical protein